MNTQRVSSHTPKRITLIILCGFITASVSAYGWDNRSSDRTPNGYGKTYKDSDAKKSKSFGHQNWVSSEQTRQSDAKYSKQADGYRQGENWREHYSNRSDDQRERQYNKDGNATSNGHSWSYREDNHSYYDSEKRASEDHHRDSFSKTAKVYDLPTFRSGRYYYSSRPSYRPCRYGYWAFDYRTSECRRSLYFHFGFFPYVLTARTFVSPYLSISYKSGPIKIGDGYYLTRHYEEGLDRALSDIREAWVSGRFDLFRNHVQPATNIAILLDGKYDYTVSSDDYLQMTSDAIDQIQTVNFTWQSIRERVDGSYVAFADHTYRDSSGVTKTVYVSYTFRRYADEYQVIEAGSSNARQQEF